MSIKIQRIINFAMILFSWSTLLFLGKRNIKRFLPAALFIIFIEGIHTIIGKRKKWWVFYNKPNSVMFGEFPFIVGPFFVSSMWILKWTYGKFRLFLLVNGILNAIFAFPVARISKKIGYYTLVRFNGFQFFLYFFGKAFLLYGFQKSFEHKRKNKR